MAVAAVARALVRRDRRTGEADRCGGPEKVLRTVVTLLPGEYGVRVRRRKGVKALPLLATPAP
ncbi:hypothetical protein GCM10009788_25050 [Nocardioides humi]|uniref:Transposase n=1 Tax=Nocardioides humi TaxID=449461 RepID=A0ABN2AJU2_9ACTN